jgi:hypothetical protein
VHSFTPDNLQSDTDLIPVKKRSLTPAQYGALADVPPEIEWLANITNPKTRRAYKNDVSEFSAFTGLRNPVELRTVTRAHVIAWRKDLEKHGGRKDNGQSPAGTKTRDMAVPTTG